MIDISSYTTALASVLSTALPLYEIERSERINFDPGRCPWIGVYPGPVESTPKTLGAGNSRWSNAAELQFVVQTASYSDEGQEASDQLEGIVGTALQAIDLDLSLGVQGCRVLSVSREYQYVVFDDDAQGSIFMPQCLVKLRTDIRSS